MAETVHMLLVEMHDMELLFILADNNKILNYLLLMANNDKITDNFPIIKKKK